MCLPCPRKSLFTSHYAFMKYFIFLWYGSVGKGRNNRTSEWQNTRTNLYYNNCILYNRHAICPLQTMSTLTQPCDCLNCPVVLIYLILKHVDANLCSHVISKLAWNFLLEIPKLSTRPNRRQSFINY